MKEKSSAIRVVIGSLSNAAASLFHLRRLRTNPEHGSTIPRPRTRLHFRNRIEKQALKDLSTGALNPLCNSHPAAVLREGELGPFEIRNLAGLIGLTGNEDVCPFISQPALVGRRRQPSAVDVAGREKPHVDDCEAQPANGFHQGAGPGSWSRHSRD